MWDRTLDEGIFLCDHESDIITKDFLQSLSYVHSQLDVPNWIEPNQFLTNELEFIAYILLTHNGEVGDAIIGKKYYIDLPNRKHNEIFQGKLAQNYYETQLFIYKLFESGQVYDNTCARCYRYMYVWDEKCKKCIDWETEDSQEGSDLKTDIPKIGTVNCSECEGFSYRYDGRYINGYCEYNMKTGKRYDLGCEECKEHFDWLDKKRIAYEMEKNSK